MGRSVVVILFGIAVSAHARAAQDLSVDEIVARHVEARGGYTALKAIQTLKVTRTVATAFSDVRVVIYRKRPHLYRAEQGLLSSKAPLVPRGVNSATAWDIQGGRVVLRSAGAAAETRDLDADFDGLLVDWKGKGHAVTSEGRERLPSGDTYKLRVRTRSGAERTIYLDAATFLERRQTGTLNVPAVDPSGKPFVRSFSVVIDFDNHKAVNGVRFAHDITEERTGTEPVQSLVIYTESIEVNLPLDDSLFEPPAPKP